MIVRENGNGSLKEAGLPIEPALVFEFPIRVELPHEGSPTDGRTILARAVSRDASI